MVNIIRVPSILSPQYSNLHYSNLERRVFEHKSGIEKSFTKRYLVNKLVYYEIYFSPNDSISREKQLKNWTREWKIELVRKHNSNFMDLTDTYGNIIRPLTTIH